VQAKNPEPLAALVTYLEKHRAEIIDYGRRQRAGKPIGSDRMAKGVDQGIGARQKHKGMSWSPTGSKALGILKVVELNQRWEQTVVPSAGRRIDVHCHRKIYRKRKLATPLPSQSRLSK
jgi:hypothetical protein